MKTKPDSSSTRLQITDAANRVILDHGTNALTLDAVARQAGVSKGGLLYHFPNKDSLIEGMLERFIDDFEAAVDADLQANGGGWLSAYVRVSGENNPEREKVSFALFAAFANNPDLLEPLRKKFDEWQNKMETGAVSPEVGAIIRLTLDGLWLADLLNFSPPPPALRKQVLQRLLNMNPTGNETK